MQIKTSLVRMLADNSALNKNFLYRPLKNNERIEMFLDGKCKQISKKVPNPNPFAKEPLAEKSVFKDSESTILCNKINTDTYVGECSKYTDGQLYFNRKFIKNNRVYKVVDEHKAFGKHVFAEATLENNIMTEYIRQRSLRSGKISEKTIKKYYNYNREVIQTELYDKDNKLVERNICTDGLYSIPLYGDRVSFIKTKADGTQIHVKNAPTGNYDFQSVIDSIRAFF